jgi:hypothetical protein
MAGLYALYFVYFDNKFNCLKFAFHDMQPRTTTCQESSVSKPCQG